MPSQKLPCACGRCNKEGEPHPGPVVKDGQTYRFTCGNSGLLTKTLYLLCSVCEKFINLQSFNDKKRHPCTRATSVPPLVDPHATSPNVVPRPPALEPLWQEVGTWIFDSDGIDSDKMDVDSDAMDEDLILGIANDASLTVVQSEPDVPVQALDSYVTRLCVLDSFDGSWEVFFTDRRVVLKIYVTPTPIEYQDIDASICVGNAYIRVCPKNLVVSGQTLEITLQKFDANKLYIDRFVKNGESISGKVVLRTKVLQFEVPGLTFYRADQPKLADEFKFINSIFQRVHAVELDLRDLVDTIRALCQEVSLDRHSGWLQRLEDTVTKCNSPLLRHELVHARFGRSVYSCVAQIYFRVGFAATANPASSGEFDLAKEVLEYLGCNFSVADEYYRSEKRRLMPTIVSL